MGILSSAVNREVQQTFLFFCKICGGRRYWKQGHDNLYARKIQHSDTFFRQFRHSDNCLLFEYAIVNRPGIGSFTQKEGRRENNLLPTRTNAHLNF